MSVYYDCKDLNCTAQRDAEVTKRGANSYKLYNQLFVRHWDVWETGVFRDDCLLFPFVA
jgi:hypothetical protein